MVRLEIAAIYIGINILILVVLAALAIKARFTHQIVLGDGGLDPVQRAVRAHGNAAETIPVGLIGLLTLALLDAATPLWLLHFSGACLTLGRLAHGIGLSMGPRNLGRGLGMLLTFIALVAIALGVIYAGLAQAL
jgi:uncharacterized membrane protein YecN with MAPEG domain